MSAAQDRRPGLRALAETISRRNPHLSFEACASIAKQQWTLRAFDQLNLKACITPAAAPDKAHGGLL